MDSRVSEFGVRHPAGRDFATKVLKNVVQSGWGLASSYWALNGRIHFVEYVPPRCFDERPAPRPLGPGLLRAPEQEAPPKVAPEPGIATSQSLPHRAARSAKPRNALKP